MSDPVSVILESQPGRIVPLRVLWRGRVYKIEKLGFYHRQKRGTRLFHIFSVVTAGAFLRLSLDSRTLLWRLEEVSERF